MSTTHGVLAAILGLLLSSSSSNFPIPKSLCMVVDSSGAPVANAVAGNTEISDTNGVAQGTMQKSNADWLHVTAVGYADTYAKPLFKPHSFTFEQYSAILTPFTQVVTFHTSSTLIFTLQTDNISLAVSPAQLSKVPAQLGIAEIKPAFTQPLFEELNPQMDLNLQMAFAVQSWDFSLEPVELRPNSTLQVTINDGGGSQPPPVLAEFYPENGYWQVLPSACTRQSEDTLNCTIHNLSPMFGLFTDAPVQYTSSKTSTMNSSKIFSPADAMNDDELSFINAANRIRHRLNIMGGANNYDPTDQELNSALGDLVDSAMDNAKNNHNEAAKTQLMAAAEAAFSLGNTDLGNSAVNKAAEIANELGQKMLQADCSQYKEIMHIAEQNFMLGNQSTGEQLVDKVAKELNDCDVWSGTITYWIHLANSLPANDDLKRTAGGGSWWEKHNVIISTSPKTYQSKGHDNLTLEFSHVKYENTNLECEQSISYSGSGAIELSFNGFYNGETFAMGDVVQESGPGTITRQDVMEGKEDNQCKMVSTYPHEFSYFHYSFLAHGVSSPSPPVTIQEILDSAAGQHRVFGGDTTFVNNNPQLGTYPFQDGTIIWRFLHVHQALPPPQ